ncbi:cytochrome P450 [Fusarium solani]|uniref:Cytochrome P450 n=1 Tax=Fusarium solani TaxID=169388 RepID=A0A9P9H1H2_FUSSL|nr:cytochrome P450 [Fusarium solani]KAH7248152.1 cytochrome P450 [Fusarium solani]
MLVNTLELKLSELYISHSLSALLNILIVGQASYTILRLFYTIFLSGLRKVPGPFLARLTRFWEVKKVSTGDIHDVMIDLHKQHGPIVRIAPNRYDFNTPEAVKIIYRIGNAFHKSHFYDPFGSPQFKNLLNELDNGRHAAMRRQVASLYTMSALLSYENAVNVQTSILKKRLQDFASQGQVIDVPQFLQYYAFDVIGAITVGSSMGMMESNSDLHGACRELDGIWRHAAVVGLVPGLHPWIVRLASLLRLPSVTDGLDSFVDAQLHRYKEKASQGATDDMNATFIGAMLKLQEQGKATDADTRLCLAMNIGAGSDTTAISLSSAIYYLYTNPHTLRRLREELDGAAQAGKVSSPISFQQAQEMPYLQAVIKEALRLHPGVGTQLTRVVPKGGVVIEGQFFPEGVEVGVNAWALYHNQDAFGKDASEFRPERWLEPDNEDLRIAGSFAFGAGPRSCLGKNISILEMSKAIPQIVSNFHLYLEPNNKEWKNKCWWFVKPEYKAQVECRTI